MTKDTQWRGSWRSSKGAKPRQQTPEQRSAELAGFADRDARNQARRDARLAGPEPTYISPARLDAIEQALEAGIKAEAASREWTELIADRAGRCLRNERHEDGHWQLCDNPTLSGKLYCEHHYDEPVGVAIPLPSVESTITPPPPHPFDPADDPAVDETRHLRIGRMFPMAYRPSETTRNKWGLRSSKPAAPPAEPPNPTLERERAAEPFPVREVSRTVTKYEPHEYVLNPRPLEPCSVNAAHGFYEGAVCGRCVEDVVRQTKEDEKTAHKRAQGTERVRRFRLKHRGEL
jgi:hypothetical protein